MTEYPIIKDHFTKSDCYKSTKKCSKTGIQVHSVGSKGTRKERWRKSWDAPDRTVCAGYLIDMDGIWEILPEGKRCWLSGSGVNGNANNDYLGFEICEPLTRESTPEVMDDIYGKVLYLCTYLCKKFGISPANVRDHAELHKMGVASNHADVGHWWGKEPWQDYTMDRLRNDIAKEIVNMPETPQEAPQTTMQTLRYGSEGSDVEALQTKLNAWNDTLPIDAFETLIVDGKLGQLTQAAVVAFQTAHDLKQDGIVGKNTWRELAKIQPPETPKDDNTQDGEQDKPTYTVQVCNLSADEADELVRQYYPNATVI